VARRRSVFIPVASGLGAVPPFRCLARAADAAGQPLSFSTLSAIVYQVEISTTALQRYRQQRRMLWSAGVSFGQAPKTLSIGRTFMLAIADTGVASPTRLAVAEVRRAREREAERFDVLFDRIASIVEQAKTAITGGFPEALGALMDENHTLLAEIGVSSPALDALAETARGAGASGAKLSGAGRGGNLIALVTADTREAVTAAMRAAGALNVIVTTVGNSRH
jgi:mevalonate kinase